MGKVKRVNDGRREIQQNPQIDLSSMAMAAVPNLFNGEICTVKFLKMLVGYFSRKTFKEESKRAPFGFLLPSNRLVS